MFHFKKSIVTSSNNCLKLKKEHLKYIRESALEFFCICVWYISYKNEFVSANSATNVKKLTTTLINDNNFNSVSKISR